MADFSDRLSDEQTAEVTAAFKLFAKPNKKGKLFLSVKQLPKVCRALGLGLTVVEYSALVKAVNVSSAGKIILTDWIEGYAEVIKNPFSDDKLSQQFNGIDEKRNKALACGKDQTLDVLDLSDMAAIVRNLKLDGHFEQIPGVPLEEGDQVKDLVKQFDSVIIPEEYDPITGIEVAPERPLDDMWTFQEFKDFMRP